MKILARKYHSIPASSTFDEEMWSIIKNVANDSRPSLDTHKASDVMFIKMNLCHTDSNYIKDNK